ncbi:YkgJ family cysteine cluster protein [uncultured Oceanisphaera sp.]|uniref:YkgJ family cysteine cluster protein n=1 Tax=uncultured Oceanisphaera sp. TaxID=353858 RepID=UPI00345B7853
MNKENKEFPCYQCGKCCSNVHLSELTRYLDRGDGVCRHLDKVTKLCSIYNERPEICRVKVQYDKNYK